jgi:hypothetical protein
MDQQMSADVLKLYSIMWSNQNSRDRCWRTRAGVAGEERLAQAGKNVKSDASLGLRLQLMVM